MPALLVLELLRLDLGRLALDNMRREVEEGRRQIASDS
jgi:hypothetical protein